jgi:nucleoside-diphosphate-sugar epimerase
MLKCGITGLSGVLGKAIRKELNYKFISFKERIENKNKIYRWVKNNDFDLIIHLAAVVPTNIVNNNFNKANKINYKGTKYIVDAILKYKPNLKWFFFSSTSHVYKIKNFYEKIDEKATTSASTKYGLTKLRAENYIINKLKNTSVRYCIGRIFSYSAINQKKPYLIPTLIYKIKKSEDKYIYFKDLNHCRDFLSLKKICTAINILRKSNAKGIYNIASGKSFLLEDIAKYISNKFNKKCKFIKNKKTFLIGNINKLNRIGFSSKENFHKILDKIIKKNK